MDALRTVLLLGTALATSGSGAETVLLFEPAHTEIHWTLNTVMHTVHGTFHLRSGSVHFDPATGRAWGELIVDAASGESGSDSRDSRMRKSILEAPKFPAIVFTPDRVNGAIPAAGAGTVKVHGAFKLHGADHEFVLPMQVNVQPSSISTSSRFTIPYLAWGLKNPSTFVLRVSDKVEIDLKATGRVELNGSR